MSKLDTPEVRQGRGSPAPVPGKCGAKLWHTDPPRYCLRPPRIGRKGCKTHGGNTPIGPDAVAFKHGGRSKYAMALSPKLLAQFETTLADDKLLDLKPDIALLDLLTWQAAAGINDDAPSVAQWREAQEAYAQLVIARTKTAVEAAMAKLKAVLGAAVRTGEAREEVSKHIERRAKAVRVYEQLQTESGDKIYAKHVGVSLAIFAMLMREFIQDDDRRREFSRRFAAALAPRLRAATDAVDAEPAAGS